MTKLRARPFFVLGTVAVCSLALHAPAWAQAWDGWSFVVTPQVWISHIAHNGFVSAGTLGGLVQFNDDTNPTSVFTNLFEAGDSRHVGGVSPQWGAQVAAQKGRWTLAGSFQLVEFETQTDILFAPATNRRAGSMFPGDLGARESINTNRLDVDLAVTYLFPDVVRDWLDLSLGGGFKFIYADASRRYRDINPVLLAFGEEQYLVCKQDDCTDGHFTRRAKSRAWLYGATLPTSAILHVTRDAKWLLPFSVSPFLGAETRDDRDVAYVITPDVAPFDGSNFFFGRDTKVKRLDGTKFAYGVTSDATMRYAINDTVSVYAGMRVQYIKGHEEYLAYGPLVGMSVRFGGK